MSLSREQIAMRAAREIGEWSYVNLGIGIPTLVADYLPADKHIYLHSENGLLGMGPRPEPDFIDRDLTNAGKDFVTALPGASIFDSAESFAIIRGRHLDLAILGGMQVSQTGDLANWMVPGKLVKGIGGGMDLVNGAKRVIVVMDHCDKGGTSKIVPKCTLPLTGVGVVSQVITNLAVIDVTPKGLVLKEVAPGMTSEAVRKLTAAPLTVAEDVKEMEF